MIKITFEVPNLNEAEFVLRAVRGELDRYRAANPAPTAGPREPTTEVEVTPTVQPQPTIIAEPAPKKAPGRPKKTEPAAPDAVTLAQEPDSTVTTPGAAAPANIFDAPAAAPAQAGRTPKDALNALYTKIADANGAGAAITATMGLLKEFGVSRVQDVPQDKWAAFDQRVGAMGA